MGCTCGEPNGTKKITHTWFIIVPVLRHGHRAEGEPQRGRPGPAPFARPAPLAAFARPAAFARVAGLDTDVARGRARAHHRVLPGVRTWRHTTNAKWQSERFSVPAHGRLHAEPVSGLHTKTNAHHATCFGGVDEVYDVCDWVVGGGRGNGGTEGSAPS